MRRRLLQGRVSMQEPGGRSPDASPGRWTDHPSVGSLGHVRGFGPGCGKVGLRQARLAWWTDLSKRQAAPAFAGGRGPEDDRAGRSCARQVKVAGHRAQPERPAPPSKPSGGGRCEAMNAGRRASTAQERAVAQVRLALRDPGQPQRKRLGFREGVLAPARLRSQVTGRSPNALLLLASRREPPARVMVLTSYSNAGCRRLQQWCQTRRV